MVFLSVARLGLLYLGAVGGWASAVCCSHGAIAIFLMSVGRASWLFVKHPHLNQLLYRARLFEKKNLGSVASREDFFSKTSDEGAALTSKAIVEKFAIKKSGEYYFIGFKRGIKAIVNAPV